MQLRLPLIFLFIFFVGHFSIAQSVDKAKIFNLGLMFGGNISSFGSRVGEFGRGNEYDNFVRIGPVIGVHTRYQITKRLSLRGEVLFNARGGSYRKEASVISIGGDGSKNYHTKNYRLNYAEIPLLAEIDFMPHTTTERLHVKLAAGASVGVPTASTLRYNGYAPTGSTSGPLVDVEENFEVMHVGHAASPLYNAIGELSFDFLSGKDTPLFVRIRYSGSLNNAYDQDKINNYSFRTKMTTWSLTFGFYFRKNR